MSISFNQVPNDVLTPFTFVEFDSSQASRNLGGTQPYKILVIGQKLASGTASTNKVVRVGDASKAAELFGWGSMLHHQFRCLRDNNTQTETFAIALDDPGSPSNRTYQLQLAGSAENETQYTIVLRKGQQTKEATFTSTGSATVAKVLTGLKNAVDSVDIVSSSNIASSRLSIVVADGWSIDQNTKFQITPPSGEIGRSSGSFVINSVPTLDGILSAYVGDRRYAINVKSGQTVAVVASALAAAINDDDLAYVTATNNTGTVNLSAKHRGSVGSEISLQLNYLSTDSFPDGLEGTTVNAMTDIATNPSLATALADIDDTQFNVIVMPYHDATSLNAIHNLLDERWGPANPYDGQAFTAKNDTLAGLVGVSLNSPHVTILDSGGLPTPPYLYAAAVAGINAREASNDPALPQQTLQVKSVWASKSPRKREERDTLLKAGIATHTTIGNNIYIERLVTSYTQNSLGAKDVSYRDVQVKQTLSFLRWDFRNHFNSRYARFKLADDADPITPGQPILTPKAAKAEVIAKFKQWQAKGLVQDIEQFKSELVVQIYQADPNRLDILMPPNLINQLRVVGAKISYLL